MRAALIVSLMVIFAMTAAACASIPQAPSPTAEMDETPDKTVSRTPETHQTPGMGETPDIPDKTPKTSETPETPDETPGVGDSFFFHPPSGEPGEVAIHIDKGRRVLELMIDGEAAGRFPIGLGPSPEGDKEREGDGRTPVGSYYVCTRNDQSNYYLSLGVSYPNTGDAKEALDSGLIDRETYERIAGAEAREARPDWDTPLGGAICIHGGGATDWTLGCVALENEAMDILWEYCPMGTPILIYE